ncbi:MAG: hypothetical protein F6K10_12895 [Moorea sp. SIO2B7]|nr:hypothetical protein [Moorena sp. SIO2B7]
MVYVPSSRSSKRNSQKTNTAIWAVLIGLGSVSVIFIWGLMFVSEVVTLGGVPYRVIMKFLQDETAKTAYFQGNSQKLHDRLDEMGIEEAMKEYYRPKITDEIVLDQHIHQILYERTGYIGMAYNVNSQGVLILKKGYKLILDD